MEEQIKRGILEMCVLSLLSRNDYHGYKLAKEIRSYFPEVNESTIYGILRRLHEEHSVDIFRETDPKTPVRKYYKINYQGRDRLSSALTIWLHVAKAVEDICF